MNSPITVREAMWSVSGRIFAVLQCSDGKFDVMSQVASRDGKEWEILDNAVAIGTREKELLRLSDEKFIFFFELIPLGHASLPVVGEILNIVH